MSDETIEATAEVIDVPDVLSGADRWLAETRDEVAALLGKYGTHEIANEADYRDIKQSRTMLRKDIAQLDAQRKAQTKAVDEVLARFRSEASMALAPLTEVEVGYKAQLDAWEAGAKGRRTDYLQSAYEEYAPALVPLVPLSAIADRYAKADGWYLKRVTDEGAAALLRKRLDGIAADWATIGNLDMTDQERQRCRSAYTSTLDLGAAVKAVADERERLERVAEIEAAQAAPEPMPEPEPAPEPDEETAQEPEPTATYRFEVTCTKAQMDALMGFLRANGIHGRRCAA